MKAYRRLTVCVSVLLATSYGAYAQKGLPATTSTNASVNTAFPQHEEFSEQKTGQLVVPAGFKVSVAATGLGKPRMIAFSNDGSLYVTRRDQGDVLCLKDTDKDGRFDDLNTVVAEFKGVHGIAIRNHEIWLCSNKQLKKGTISPTGEVSKLEMIFDDLPDGGQHGNRTLAFGPDDMLYISVGSTCNDCGETNKESATLIRVDTKTKERKVFARGLRNTIGFDWHPATKELWGADNGTDWRGDEIPHEELNKIIEGGHYGWPLVYDDKEVDETREDPPGSTKEAFAQTTESPALLFPAHSAPINLVFLEDASVPTDYKDDCLITLHGSWNRKNPEGYKVVRVVFENGRPRKYENFLDGFLSKDGKTRFGRPTGLAVSPDGAVYVSDDVNGVIYWVASATVTAK